jgi:kynurenine formamidase
VPEAYDCSDVETVVDVGGAKGNRLLTRATVALPMKIEQGTGGPCRIIAIQP